MITGSQGGGNGHYRWAMITSVGFLWAICGCGHAQPDSQDARDAGVADKARVVVRVQPVERRSMAQTLTALGRCDALPEKLALLTMAVEGRVEAILVEQGEDVAQGQPLVRLDATLAQADLAEKQAARDSLMASLRLLESLPRTKEQEASKLAIELARITVERTAALVERLQPLRARDEVSDQQLFEAEQSLKQARVEQRTAEAQYDALMLGPRPEAVAEAQAKIQTAEEAVKLSQARLELHTIRAPIAGVLDSLTCRLGQTIAVGTSIGQLIDSQQVLITAWLPVSSGRLASRGQLASVWDASASARHDQHADDITGRVVFVGRVADAQTGNMPVQIIIDNAHGGLVIGQILNVQIAVGQPPLSLAIPATART